MSLRRACPLLLAAWLVAPGGARADDDQLKARCVRGHVDGQRLRLAGDLDGARRELRACAQEACPALVHRDCVGWLREVEALIPTVVFAARDSSGVDLSEVRVFVDGRLVKERLGGTAVEVRAGERLVRFEAPGHPPVETKVIVAAGEKNRVVRASIGTAMGSEEGATDVSRALPFALGGLGVTAATVGLVLDLIGSGELGDLRDSCAPFCSTEQVDSARTKIIVGDTLLAVGVVTVGAAAVWLLLRDPATGPPAGAAKRRAAPARRAWAGGL